MIQPRGRRGVIPPEAVASEDAQDAHLTSEGPNFGEDRERTRTLSVADPTMFVSRLEFAFSKYTLKFIHRDLGYEEEYLADIAERVYKLVRVAYWLVFLFWLPFTYIDVTKTEGENQIGIIVIRGIAGVLSFLLAAGGQWWPGYKANHQIMSSLGIGGLCTAMELSILLTDTFKDGPATVFIAFLAGPFVTQQQFRTMCVLLVFLCVEFAVISWFATTLAEWASMNLVSVTVCVLGLFYRYTSELKSRQNFILRCQIRREREALEVEKDKSDALLRNILPHEISDRLKEEEGRTISDKHDMSTVLFADITGFDRHANRLSAQDVVLKLNEVICAFDLICEEHGIEKIKTIGTTFMAVAGVPTYFDDHAIRAARTAVAMQEALPEICKDIGIPLQVMIGLNSGPTVAGVIGTSKISYDVWGDSVNMASRMESNSEPGRIQLSEATQVLLKDCSEFNIRLRGNIDVKGKGNVPAYFLTSATQAKDIATSNTLAPPGASRRRRSTFRDDQVQLLSAVSREASPRGGSPLPSPFASPQPGDRVTLGVPRKAPSRRASYIDDIGLARTPNRRTSDISTASFHSRGSRRPSDILSSKAPSRKTSQLSLVTATASQKKGHAFGDTPGNPAATGTTPPPLAGDGDLSLDLEEGTDGNGQAVTLEKQLTQFVHKRSMRFLDTDMEYSFKRHVYDEMMPLLRKYLLLGLVLFVTFGLIDVWLYPQGGRDVEIDMYLVRAFGAVLIIAYFSVSFHRNFIKAVQPLTCIIAGYAALFGAYVLASGRPYLFASMRISVLILFIYTLPLISHLYLSATAWAATVLYLAAAFVWSEEPAGEIAVTAVVMIVAHTFGYLSAYNKERSSRLDFMLLRRLREEHKKLEAQKSLTEALLYNILPRRIARKLIADPKANIAERFPEAVVLFSDIVSFTKMSSTMTPSEVVHMLNTMFVGFDKAANTLRLEKIKTIGDAYMVAGLPIGNIDAVRGMAEMAIAMMDHMQWMRDNGFPDIKIRIGINMGPVLAGIIGIRKFIYDIFGPNVVLGNKMEELGRPSMTHVPDNFYQRLKDEYDFEHKEEPTTVEGFGTFQTYFLLGRKATASAPGYIDTQNSTADLFVQDFEEQDEVISRFRQTIDIRD